MRRREIVEGGFSALNDLLAAKDYVAETALFCVEFWADMLKIDLPSNCLVHCQRILTRPAAQPSKGVLREEGYL